MVLVLGTPGLPKTTWPKNHYGIPLTRARYVLVTEVLPQHKARETRTKPPLIHTPHLMAPALRLAFSALGAAAVASADQCQVDPLDKVACKDEPCLNGGSSGYEIRPVLLREIDDLSRLTGPDRPPQSIRKLGCMAPHHFSLHGRIPAREAAGPQRQKVPYSDTAHAERLTATLATRATVNPRAVAGSLSRQTLEISRGASTRPAP